MDVGKSHTESIKPYNGQWFRELREAVDFYKRYALNVGFDVRHSTLVKARDKTILWKFMVCSCDGYKHCVVIDPTALDEGRAMRRRVSNRVGRNARIGLRALSQVVDARMMGIML
ncbi:FAR1-related protein [Striga asiatica]|uniref:FAR1-related protein n=1 Tax=Striga asiatica TaxID=4170 RepID=A0A5A7QYR6_STRAF|nr:FAR1-related protein [Striga asiatica]